MRRLLAVATLCGLVAVGACRTPAAGSVSIVDDEALIRRIDSVWSSALHAKDLDAVMTNYAEDAAFLAPGQPLLQGRPAIRAWFERTTAIPGYSATFEPTVIVVARAGDMAYEIGRYRVTFRGEDGAPQTRVGKHLVTWVKQGDRWLVSAESISGDS